MASSINASTSGAGGVITTADSSGVLNIQTAGTTAVTVDASQNVGIGTTSPGALLHTYTSTQESVRFARNSTSSSAYVTFYANNSSSAQVQYAGILGDVASSTAGSHGGNLLFYTTGSGTNAERMRIDSSGRLLVGTTSSSNADAKFAVLNAGSGSIIMQIQRGGENPAYIGSDNSNIFSIYDSGITQRFRVTSAGSCQNTTGSYGSISDVKLKENIVDATPKLEKVMQLQVKNFNLKTDPDLKQIGFIAQELQQVFPSLVEQSEDEDENGEKTGEITLGVKTTVLIPILVKAIQEQQTIINDLKARVTALEAK